MPVTYIIAGKNKQVEISLPNESTVADLKKAYAKESKKSIHQLSFKFGETRLDDDSKKISTYGAEAGSIITFKDLGTQIGYRTVFLGEFG